MSSECETIHRLFRSLERHRFPFSVADIPLNGVYVLFEKGEYGHGGERIVRIGSHSGEKQLLPRLKQHFLNQNKDRSIFRKNIGRSLLKRNSDPFLELWEIDLTTREARDKYSHLIDLEHQKSIESGISQYIQSNFSFCVFEVIEKAKRLEIESKLISTVSLCEVCRPSDNWLGGSSPKPKIMKSGLWQVNELYKAPFDASGIECLSRLIKA